MIDRANPLALDSEPPRAELRAMTKAKTSRPQRRRPLMVLDTASRTVLAHWVAMVGLRAVGRRLGFPHATIAKLVRGYSVSRATALAARLLIAEVPHTIMAEAA